MNNTLTANERMAMARVVMPQLPADVRSRNFEEVNRGLSDNQAFTEAQR